MKKLIYIFIIFAILLDFTMLPVFSYEDDEIDDEETKKLVQSLEASSSATNSPDVNSTHIIAIDRNTKRILYEKSGFEKTPMASTTKILTCIIALENCKLSDSVHISSNAAHTAGSTLGIKTDSDMIMEDLLYGLMLRSRK